MSVKISALPDGEALTGTEEVPVVQSDITVKVTTQDIANLAYPGASSAPANTVFAGPTSGGSGGTEFRALVSADLPTVPITKGGTGQVTAAAGFDALAPTTTRGDLIFRNATTNTRLGASTSGYLLQTNGAGTDPTWAGFTQTGSGVTTLTWPNKVQQSPPILVEEFGAVGDDVTDDGPAFLAAMTAAGGRTIKLKGGATYRIATAVSTSGLSFTLDARGANIHVDANINAFFFQSGISDLQAVSSIASGGAQITVADGSAFAAGDIIRVISDDTPLDGLTVISGNPYVLGEPVMVLSVAGNDLTLVSPLYYETQYATNVRVYKITSSTNVQVIGGRWYFTAGHEATPWTGNMLTLQGLVNPVVRDVRITKGYGIGIGLIGTISALIEHPRIENLTDNLSNSQYGYGVADNGYWTTIVGISGYKFRHLVTTTAVTCPTGTTTETQLHRYGHSVGLRVLGGQAVGSDTYGFDTHHQSRDVYMTGLFVQDCEGAVSVRSQGAIIDGVDGRNLTGDFFSLFSEAYVVGVSTGVADEDGWTTQVSIGRVMGDCAGRFANIFRAQNVSLDGPAEVTCGLIDAINITDATAEATGFIDLTVNDTTGTSGVIAMLDVSQSASGGSTFAPTFTQRDGSNIILDATGSTFSTGFSIARSGRSGAMVLTNVSATMSAGSVGPLMISFSAPAGTLSCYKCNYDVAGGGEAGVTLSSGTVSINMLSADGTNDRTDLSPTALQRFKSVRIDDTNASHWLGLLAGSNLTANRTLTFTTGDADRTLDISAGSITLAAGTYTPTLFNTTNVASSTAYLCHYSRVGNVVTVSGRVDVTPTAAASTSTSLGISLPIASNFASSVECTGTAATTNIVSVAAGIVGSAGSDRAVVVWLSSSTSAHEMCFTFVYQVI